MCYQGLIAHIQTEKPLSLVKGLGTKECICDRQKCVWPEKNGGFVFAGNKKDIFIRKIGKENKYFRTACQCPCSCSTLLLPSSALTLGSASIPSIHPSSSVVVKGVQVSLSDAPVCSVQPKGSSALVPIQALEERACRIRKRMSAK